MDFVWTSAAMRDLTFPFGDKSSLIRLASFGRETESAFDGHSLLHALKPNLSTQRGVRTEFWQDVSIAYLHFIVR